MLKGLSVSPAYKRVFPTGYYIKNPKWQNHKIICVCMYIYIWACMYISTCMQYTVLINKTYCDWPMGLDYTYLCVPVYIWCVFMCVCNKRSSFLQNVIITASPPITPSCLPHKDSYYPHIIHSHIFSLPVTLHCSDLKWFSICKYKFCPRKRNRCFLSSSICL